MSTYRAKCEDLGLTFMADILDIVAHRVEGTLGAEWLEDLSKEDIETLFTWHIAPAIGEIEDAAIRCEL